MAEMQEVIIPSNPADLKELKSAFQEISGAYHRMEGERDYVKETIADLAEKTGLPKRLLSKLSKAYHKSDKDKIVAETETLEEAYDAIFGIKTTEEE